MKQRRIICEPAMNLQGKTNNTITLWFYCIRTKMESGLFVDPWKALPIKKMMQNPGFTDIGVSGIESVLFSCSGNNIKSSIIIDADNLPELVHDIMIFLPVFQRINLLGTRSRRK